MAATGGCKGKSICSKHVTMLTAVIMSFGVISCCLGHGEGDRDDRLRAEGKGCIESERRALLAIRSDMFDSDERFSSWIGEDCCSWRGVACDNATSHVIKLDLHYLDTYNFYTYGLDDEDNMCFMLEGMGASKVNPALRDLRHLKYLDLSMNNFSDAPVPHMIASLVHLEYLNLSNAMFGGLIPPQLGNLSNLHFLDLGGCGFTALRADDLDWLSRIPSLKYIDMSFVNLSKATNWLHQVNSIPSLEVLHLRWASLSYIPSPLPLFNMTSIVKLDISHYLNFYPAILRWFSHASSLAYLDLFNCGGIDIESLQMALGALSNLKALDLQHNFIKGDIFGIVMNVSRSLKHLDLSWNSLSGDIEQVLWSLGPLEYLALDDNELHGYIPDMVENFTNSLRYLSLSSNHIAGEIPQTVGNLINLEYLDLSYNNIIGGIPVNFGNLSNLKSLRLSGNNISEQIPETIGNLQNMQSLDLFDNFITGQIPETFNRLYNLQNLDVSSNHLTRLVPGTLSKLCNLTLIFLSYNNIGGELSDLIDDLSDCNGERDLYLFVNDNSLSGIVPSSMGQLSTLQVLDLSSNLLEGNITEEHFSKLTDLTQLDISYNSLNVILPNDWLPPFNAYSIIMSSCHLGTKFPAWIQTQTYLEDLSLSGVGLSGNLPTWFPDILKGRGIRIDLSNNSLDGPIPLSFANTSNLAILSLSHNNINGSFPSFFCNLNSLQVLDLSNNNLSGKIPKCYKSFPTSLQSLHLNHNNLSGRFPSFLKHCEQLVTLDLGENNLFDEIPTWVGENLLSLRVLSLKSNLFYGPIPVHIANLTSLQVLDLSSNNLSGSIPSSLGNCRAMVEIQHDATSLLHLVDGGYYGESIVITVKGFDNQYTRILSLVTSIDLSNNNLSGEIPRELTNLHGLRFLNLSKNHLRGTIPEKIGSMEQLESLDLSVNNLTGDIPSSLSSLTFLSHLNLSHNNLSGRIPTGNQLSTLNDPSIYVGNKDLCGKPLPVCPGDVAYRSLPPAAIEEEGEYSDGEFEGVLEITSIVMGFVVGFWSCFGIMIMKQSLRVALFRLTDKTGDWVFVQLAVSFARLKSKSRRTT
uniref:Leucine-rich repeat-containing N-terminal plant-type domain-containing protein n=1 Tax=Musa acuminata subsp. malaccensis TaxID=214687 RepID=A0A804KMK7_MUSAM